MRRSIAPRLRQALAALLVGLLMLVSAEPCVAFAQPAPARPAVQAPADPCKSHPGAIACPCVQLSCQHFAVPASDTGARVETPSPAAFTLAAADAFGRTEPPPLPPPRLL